MNELTEEKRHKLKITVILLVVAFLVIYATVMFLKYAGQSQEKTQSKENSQVVFEQPTLKFFNFKVQLNEYPDRITIHYPYLVVVRPDEFRSEIYNMDTKRKEKELNEVILDYFMGDVVYNKQGFQTFYNNKNLSLLCDQAFIKSKTDIFCITRPDQNKQNNKLISINPETLKQKDLYDSQNVLTAVYLEKDTLYIGEYDFVQNKAYIMVNGKTATVNDLVNVIYPMEESMYAASFKSLRNKHVEGYSKIDNPLRNIHMNLIEKGEIIFY